VGAAHDGGTAVFDALVEEHSAAVYRLARSIVIDPSLAADVTQDTFVQVWRHLDQFRGDGSVRSWILRIAHNTAVSALRKIRDVPVAPEDLPERADTAELARGVEHRVGAETVIERLRTLDELSREILVLSDVEGLAYREIADALGVPLPTVKSRLFRARRALAAELEDWR
jgi:RNA polymerase sigma-70 factor, ECF subfamily